MAANPAHTAGHARGRAKLVEARARRIEDDLDRDRAEHRPDNARRKAGPHDQPLPNRNTRVVRP